MVHAAVPCFVNFHLAVKLGPWDKGQVTFAIYTLSPITEFEVKLCWILVLRKSQIRKMLVQFVPFFYSICRHWCIYYFCLEWTHVFQKDNRALFMEQVDRLKLHLKCIHAADLAVQQGKTCQHNNISLAICLCCLTSTGTSPPSISLTHMHSAHPHNVLYHPASALVLSQSQFLLTSLSSYVAVCGDTLSLGLMFGAGAAEVR